MDYNVKQSLKHLINVIKSLYKNTAVIINQGKPKQKWLKLIKMWPRISPVADTVLLLYWWTLEKKSPKIPIDINNYLSMLIYVDDIILIQKTTIQWAIN